MLDLVKQINKRINGLIWSFVTTGVVLMMLAVLIVWTDFMLRLVMGLLVVVIAYTFLYAGYRLWTIKMEVENKYSIFKEVKKIKK